MKSLLNNTWTVCIGMLLLLMPGSLTAGTIKGNVSVRGLRSPENILVYLVRAPVVEVDLSKARFDMDQRNLTFIPHVLPVIVGAAVNFPNNDKVDHNVFSLSRANKFNLGSFKPGARQTVSFENPGIVELRCDVHAEMAAYIMVMKSPYFSVTDRRGNFEIPDRRYLEAHGIGAVPDLPPGTYVVKTRHAKLKTIRQKVNFSGQGGVTVDLTLTRGTPGVLYKSL
ncbi:MAG: hypothetical protein JJV98_16055 [Desulfosarcina sp.]|nr:hypothetical protein [Desulfobacterales bacterium]